MATPKRPKPTESIPPALSHPLNRRARLQRRGGGFPLRCEDRSAAPAPLLSKDVIEALVERESGAEDDGPGFARLSKASEGFMAPFAVDL